MPENFASRLDAKTYKDDVEIQARLVPDPRDQQTLTIDAWLPERLMDRLRYLGLAYELPLLSRLPAQGEWNYPEVQCLSLEDEILFVLNLVSDPLLAQSVEPLLTLVRKAIREPQGRTLTIEAP